MNPISYKLHHVGLLCADPAASTHFYQTVLQFEQIGRFYEAEAYDLTFLASGGDFLLELVGAPFSAGEQAFIERRGHALHHIAFATPDVDAAFAALTASGLKVAWEPDNFEFVRHCGVFDLNGVVIEILQETQPLPKPQARANAAYRLHHPCLLTENWQESIAFYTRHFQFSSPFQYIYRHGGAFVYLVDPHFDPASNGPMLEAIGPPYEEAREFEFAASYKTGIDHIGLIVQDVGAAYRHVAAHSSGPSLPPYSDYGTSMCWVKDPDGNDLELMLPLPTDKLTHAWQTGRPYRPAHNPQPS